MVIGGVTMSKRIERVFLILEMIFYLLASIELVAFYQHNVVVLLSCILFIVANSVFRQIFLYSRQKRTKYSIISIMVQIIVISYMLLVANHPVVVMFYCTIIFEAVLVYSLYFSIPIAIGCTVFMFVWNSTVSKNINSLQFILYSFTSFGLALILVFILAYLIKGQLKEKMKVIRVNRELEDAYQRLLEKSSENQELSIEKERLRMAREIHDTLAHTLTAVIVQMEACKKLLKVDADRVLDEIDKAQKYTREGLNDVKRTIKALRPQILENGTFFDALFNLIEDVEQTMKIKILLHIDHELEIPSSMEVPFFRVIQESITNAIRHGNANQIEIDIMQDEGYLRINIKDNGRGCNVIKEGFGLKGIHERIRALHGTVEWVSHLGKGFQTEIKVPLGGGMHVGH